MHYTCRHEGCCHWAREKESGFDPFTIKLSSFNWEACFVIPNGHQARKVPNPSPFLKVFEDLPFPSICYAKAVLHHHSYHFPSALLPTVSCKRCKFGPNSGPSTIQIRAGGRREGLRSSDFSMVYHFFLQFSLQQERYQKL